MCRCLRIHPSGFYAWLKNPLSKRAREDARQTGIIRTAWKDSGKVYGYRKLHDDLLDQGETICPNRVARLARLAGIRARIGYKRRPEAEGQGAHPFGSGFTVHQYGLGVIPESAQSRTFDEPPRELS